MKEELKHQEQYMVDWKNKGQNRMYVFKKKKKEETLFSLCLDALTILFKDTKERSNRGHL